MSMLDSVATFEARALEMGMLEVELVRMRPKWNTFAKLAFACSFAPGQADDTNPRTNAAEDDLPNMNTSSPRIFQQFLP